MSLSMKALSTAPANRARRKSEADDDLPPREMAVPEREGPLKGGTNKKTGGESIGLNW